MTELGAVSLALEQEVLGELRRQGIVVWLDKDNSYTHFVDELATKQANGEFPFPVVGFRGSFLELLFKLEPFGNGLDKTPLLIHMPGFNEESIRKTPVLELYEPGVRFRKGLETLVREAATSRVAPAEVDQFIAKHPSLEEADAWLTSAVSQSTFGLSAALAELGQKMVAEALAESGGGVIAGPRVLALCHQASQSAPLRAGCRRAPIKMPCCKRHDGAPSPRQAQPARAAPTLASSPRDIRAT